MPVTAGMITSLTPEAAATKKDTPVTAGTTTAETPAAEGITASRQ